VHISNHLLLFFSWIEWRREHYSSPQKLCQSSQTKVSLYLYFFWRIFDDFLL
jgi:hypothetical protein